MSGVAFDDVKGGFKEVEAVPEVDSVSAGLFGRVKSAVGSADEAFAV